MLYQAGYSVRISIILAIFASLLLFGCAESLGQDVTPEEVALRKNFEGISSIELELRSVQKSSSRGDAVKSIRRIWQSGMLRRCDEQREVLDRNEQVVVALHRIVSLETVESAFYWEEGDADEFNANYALFERSDHKGKQDIHRHLPFDARFLGIVPRSTFQLRDGYFDMVVGAPRKDAAKSTGSDAARVVAFNRTDGELVTLMFARREAQFVMTHCEIGSGATKAKSEFTYGDADFNGIRFPSAIDIRLERDGELRFHEHTDVRVISINEPLPMDIFHLAALKLPPGVWVDGSAVPEALQKPFGHIEWDGRHLKSVSNAPGDANDVRITGSPFKRRDSFGWLRLVGVMIVVVGVGLLVLVLFVRWKKMQK